MFLDNFLYIYAVNVFVCCKRMFLLSLSDISVVKVFVYCEVVVFGDFLSNVAMWITYFGSQDFVYCEADVFGVLSNIMVYEIFRWSKFFVVLRMYLGDFVKCHVSIIMRMSSNINLLFLDVFGYLSNVVVCIIMFMVFVYGKCLRWCLWKMSEMMFIKYVSYGVRRGWFSKVFVWGNVQKYWFGKMFKSICLKKCS